MAVPPLADPPEPSPDGPVAATPAAAPRAGAAQGIAARNATADEALEAGWTGLGLPAYDPAASSTAAAPPAAAAPREEPASPKPAAPLPPRPTGRSGSFAAVAPPRPAAPGGPAPAPPPRPTGQSGSFATVAPRRPTGQSGSFAAVAPPRPAAPGGGAVAPAPRPTGRSGSFAAVAPPETSEQPAANRISTPGPAPDRRSAPPRISSTGPAPDRPSSPEPAARPSYTGPAPTFGTPPDATIRPSHPTPAPAFGAPPEPAPRPSFTGPAPTFGAAPDATIRPSYTGPAPTFGPAPDAAAARPASPTPAPAPPQGGDEELAEATDVTIEDEPDLGATIPDQGPAFHDLTATVPMLPPPAEAPSFGLPPEPLSNPPRVLLPGTPPPPPEAAEGPDASPYGPGALIGDKYRLLRIIGRGGMGAVWIAQNTALEVEVAIKLMRRDRATPEAAARFSTEARAAARLGHPSIVRVFDFGETARGDPFIVMELLRGDSFGALLARKKRLAPTIAVQTLLPVAHALAAAHAKGIVHRDLKPDNILLAKDESNVVTPKVVDFGIAKLITTDVDRHFTIAGEILGSPDYMSPEQARGEEDIDHRSDIWTFTVLLYEAVCGKRPFDGANYNALLAAIIASRPLPIMEHGVADPALWTILEKGLAKERDARWQSVREMGMELARWAIDRGVEHDLAGASLAAQWLEPTRRRLFTVGGSAPPPAPPPPGSGAPAAEPAIPRPPPLGNLAAELPRAAAPAISNTLPPFVPRRGPWIVMAFIVLAGGALVALLVWGGLFDAPSPSAALPDVSAGATTAPSAAPPAPSTTSTTAPSPSTTSAAPTADPAGNPSAPAGGTATGTKPRAPWPAKPRAPQVKGDIKF